MQYVTLHHASQKALSLPMIGFGAMGISEFYGHTDQEDSEAAVAIALKSNITHFDTADGYGYGANERYLKSALNLENNDRRQDLIISTKAGILRDEHDPSVRGISIDPTYLRDQIYKSLNNLGVKYLDIFYVHRLPPAASDDELSALASFLLEMKETGIIRAIGLSEPKAKQLSFLHELCGVSVVQSEYSLLERFVETNGTFAYCKAHNIQFVAYSPLCRGFLTDSFDVSKLDNSDFRLSLPKFSGENFLHNLSIIERLKLIAHRKNTSLASLSLAWLIAQGVCVIPGMRKPARVMEALAALKVSFTEEERFLIDDIAHVNSTKGTRYSAAAMSAYGFEQ